MRGLVNFISGALLGGVIGAAAVILVAPQSGEELRANLRHEVDAILDEGRRAARERENEMREQLAYLRGEV